ncbi:hypothetical protein MVEG_11895 [Podila verticillata NRRL 6337]|uniref:Uncharacterized protein n=1 Tax=Podila verticillata NRRL 6337 TaxID=1069443 RepID=A0A086TKM5_9FUNG|nr:hypothetical protein MVEG_11895 [Podila verticillata NRRL 6337]
MSFILPRSLSRREEASYKPQRQSNGDSALSSSSSMTTSTDKTVYILVAAAIVVATIAACVFIVKKRQLQHQPHLGVALSPSTSIRSARVSVVPQLQPPETPTTLSTFTRIPYPQPPGALTSNYPRGGRAKEFSLARLFTRSSSSNAGPSRPVSEMSWWDHGLRKSASISSQSHSLTSSTRSSQLYWDLNYPSGSYTKERKGDGCPIITLTSPSDASIPLREDPELAQLCPHTLSDDPGPSNSTSSSNVSESGASGTSSEGSGVGSLAPSHMFLHPSSSFVRHEKRVVHGHDFQGDKPSDFPPTYEEAIDGPSSNVKVTPSSPSSSLSPPGSSDTALSIPSCPPQVGAASSSSIPVNDEQAIPEYGYDPKCIIIVDDGQDLEGDPLSSLFLRSQ